MKLHVLVILVMLIMIGIAWAIFQHQVEIQNRTRVVVIGIKAYADNNCTTILNYIDWGILFPNDTVTREFYLLNVGNIPINITVYTDEWMFWDYDGTLVNITTPSDYILVSWSVPDVIEPGQIVPCFITLHVVDRYDFPFVSFAFTLYINGEYYE